MFVFDATPLVYLGRVDRLDLVDHATEYSLIPRRVYEEVVTVGIEDGHPDARRVQRAVESGTFEISAVEETTTYDRIAENDHLSSADAAVLAMAHNRDGTAIMDDAYGRTVAETEGISTRGTAFLVLVALRDGHIGPDEAVDVIDALLSVGWYCSPELYARIRGRIDELS